MKWFTTKKYANKIAWSDYLQSFITPKYVLTKKHWYFLEYETGLIKKAGTNIDFFKWTDIG